MAVSAERAYSVKNKITDKENPDWSSNRNYKESYVAHEIKIEE
jgi:hypothetical protein